MIDHLKRLGVTTIELLPVQCVRRRPPAGRDAACENYWGYNTLGFFAPDAALSASGNR